MKLELMFSTWSEFSWLIIGGSGPHKPNETRDNIFKLVRFVRVAKNESMEKLPERVWLGNGGFFREVAIWEGDRLFPVTANSVTRLPEQAITRNGDGGR